MVSLPDFDPNDPGSATPETTFNRATLGAYEMGSVFKIFTVAMALDDRVTTLEGGYDATNPIHIGRFTIHDDHAQRRWLAVPEIFEYSSNIGAAKMALDVGGERQRDFLGRLGLLSEPRFELKEIATPLVPSPWRPINTMTIGFGHGISVSPLQLATAVSAVVNGGMLHRATLLKRARWRRGRRHSGCSGPRPRSRCANCCASSLSTAPASSPTPPGYLVGGKTGTAEKVSGKPLRQQSAAFLLRRRLPDQRSALSRIGHHRRAARQQAVCGLRDRRLDRGAGGEGTPSSAWRSIVGIQPVDEDSPEIRRSLMVDLPAPQGRKLAAN